ncbi:MAG: HD domain-containing phosphohydrolase [Planctomycetota bacterium]
MARLSDLIRQGKMPEKEAPRTPDTHDKIRIRELTELKLRKDGVGLDDAGFPSESGVKKEVRKADTGLDNLAFPSETQTALLEKGFAAEPEKPAQETAAVSQEKTAGRTTEEQKTFVTLYRALYEFLNEIFTAVRANQKFSIEKGIELIAGVLDLPKAIEDLHREAIFKKDIQYDSTVHSINVMIFAIKIGNGLGYNREQLAELGLAALLHDVGVCKIPNGIVIKEGTLTNEEYALIKKHPQLGYDIIVNVFDKKYQWLADVVFQEHEREGGQGYPRGITGKEIHEYAKIIGMVDVYEALSHPRPQRKRFLPYEAAKVIVNSSKNAFAPRMIKMLITKLSCFPIGSYVVLNSKAIGSVVETNESSPLRPAIEMLYEPMGKRLPVPKLIKLQDTPLLYIVDSIFEEDLPK